jgi:hypothetical protein
MNWLSFSAPAGRHRVVSGVIVLATVVLSAWCAPSALAGTTAPSFLHREFHSEAYPTRVTIEGSPGLIPGGLNTEWKAEYGASCEGSSWTEVNSGIFNYAAEGPGGSYQIYIGVHEDLLLSPEEVSHGGGSSWSRGLTPNTSYCARFRAKNADGEAKPEIIAFKTPLAEKPEVDKRAPGEFTFPAKGHPQFVAEGLSTTAAGFTAAVEGNGAETTYAFEYAPAEAGGGRPAEGSASWKQFTSGAAGTIGVAEEHADVSANLTGLNLETTYFVRLKMHNSIGETVQTKYTNGDSSEVESFTTLTAKPLVGVGVVRNRTSDSARATGLVLPHGSETHWHFEYSESVIGPWALVPGGGVISQAQAEAIPYGRNINVGGALTGLIAGRKYYVRLFAENAAGEGEYCHENTDPQDPEICEAVSEQTQGLGSFDAVGPPSSLRTFVVHGLVGEALQVDGSVDPEDSQTSAEQTVTIEGAPTGGAFTLTFDGHETAPIAYDAPAGEGEGEGSVEAALRGIGLVAGMVTVEGAAGGPYTVTFSGADAGVSEPQIEANGSALSPSGKVTVHTDFKGGEVEKTNYRFEYVSQASFAEDGWVDAAMTPEAAVPVSGGSEVVSAALPVLTAGETYRYRLLVTSSIPGVGVLEGAEQSLTVPSFAVELVPCPNEEFRTGLSAGLPDCRAYEQVSPVEKSGSQEPEQYGGEIASNLMVAGEGGSAVFEATAVSWGDGADAGGSPYFFSREAGRGWGMTAGSPQPETGVDNDRPQIYSANVKQVALEAGYTTSQSGESPNIEYKVGPLGGPYTTVATVPREPRADSEQGSEGWVAANGSFSKLVLQTKDHSLLGEETGTKSGSDLYEYTAEEGLRQLNVNSEGTTIGICGADVVDGADEKAADGATGNVVSGPHTVSADGSRVFFYAGFGSECPTATELAHANSGSVVDPEPRLHLYMRVNGTETVDIGAYKFMGANGQGTTLLVENTAGALLAYNVESKATVAQSGGEMESEQELGSLGIPVNRVEAGEGAEPFAHPRYIYWGAGPGNAGDGQVYRYDGVEHLVQCVSCASSFDPDPKQPAFVSSGSGAGMHGGVQELSTSSANGEFEFFTTPAALVPQDVDGEISIEGSNGVHGGLGTGEYIDVAQTTSPSSDVYEWRAAGVDGCAHVQGCLALITSGRGGYKNMLLRTADEGREVFIYTRSTLVAQTGRPEGSLGEGNIYDVRVDGGFPPAPPRPTECEGDACSNPPGAPNDATPPSVTFSGAGNLSPAATPTPAATKKAVVKKKHKLKPKKKKKQARSNKKGKKAAKQASRAGHDRRARS